MVNQGHMNRLRGSVKAWNKWRQNNPRIIPDLRGVNLNRADLSGADLSGAYLTLADLSVTDLSGANLSEAYLSGADLGGADLRKANLSQAHLSVADFRKADLSQADLRKADLRKADLRGGGNLTETDLSGSYLSKADLSGADLSDANLSGAHLRKADLSDTNLTGADLSNSNLSDVNLSRSKALGTNFTGARLTGACLEDWQINSQTKLDKVICHYIYLQADRLERRPSEPDKNFEPEEFTRLFTEGQNTLEIVFDRGINWRAFALAFSEINTKLHDTEREELFLREYKVLGNGFISLKVGVPSGTEKKQIREELILQYEQKIALLPEETTTPNDLLVAAYERLLLPTKNLVD